MVIGTRANEIPLAIECRESVQSIGREGGSGSLVRTTRGSDAKPPSFFPNRNPKGARTRLYHPGPNRGGREKPPTWRGRESAKARRGRTVRLWEEGRPANAESSTGPRGGGKKVTKGPHEEGQSRRLVEKVTGEFVKRGSVSSCRALWEGGGASGGVPDAVPQWTTGQAKYSRNCTASVRYKCNWGPALMRWSS
jgi:hypothetical protein